MEKWMEKEKMLCVTIYADTTDQYSEEELEQMETEFWGQMIDIPVPEDLLWQWYSDETPNCTKEDFWRWYKEESTADDTDSLYDWLVDHNYFWKRLK